MIDKLEALLATGQDSADLRFALASAYLRQGEPMRAIPHAERALEQKPDYSAAWRVLGQAQAAVGRNDDAARSFEHGIDVAARSGDRQVAKEMHVFLRRLRDKTDITD